MMPEAYAKLLPIPPGPVYKYTSEDAGKLQNQNLTNFFKNRKNQNDSVFLKTNKLIFIQRLWSD